MPSELTTDAPHELTLANGLRVVYEPMPWLPTISASLLLPLGSATDPEGHEGSANVLHEWLQRGAGEMDSRAYSDALEDLGARRGGSSGRETSSLSMSFLADVAAQALPLLALPLRAARFDTSEFEPSRELVLQELDSLDDAPTQRMFEALQERFLASPQRRSSFGTAAGLAALTPGGVRADAERRLGPEGAILALAGGSNWGELAPLIEGAFAQWSGGNEPIPEPRLAPASRSHVTADSSQVQIGLAHPSALPGSDEAYLYSLALTVLSGSPGARLFTEVREKRGLVYSVSAFSRALRGFGYTLGYAGTTPERAAETLEVFLAELKRLREGVDADELERARTGILASVVMQGESSGRSAGRLASDLFHIGRVRTLSEIKSRIEGITLSAVNDYLEGEKLPEVTVVTLGPDSTSSEQGDEA